MSSSNIQSNNKKSQSVRPAIETLEGRAYLSGVPATVAVTVPGPIPSAVIAGVKANDKISVNVANNDVNRAKGRISITLFASLDNTLSVDDAQIQPATIAGIAIAPGHNHSYKINVKTFPQNLSGNYFILANVAGTGVNTQVGASITQANVLPAFRDLAGTVLSAPGNGRVGHKIPVTVQVTNSGNIPAKGSLGVEFGLSLSNAGTSPVALGTLSKPISIKPGQSKVIHFSVPLAVGLPTGNQYIVADVDPNNVFLDPNLANNINTFQTPISVT